MKHVPRCTHIIRYFSTFFFYFEPFSYFAYCVGLQKYRYQKWLNATWWIIDDDLLISRSIPSTITRIDHIHITDSAHTNKQSKLIAVQTFSVLMYRHLITNNLWMFIFWNPSIFRELAVSDCTGVLLMISMLYYNLIKFNQIFLPYKIMVEKVEKLDHRCRAINILYF